MVNLLHLSDFHLSNPSWRDLAVVLAGLGVGAGSGSGESLLEVFNSRDWSKLLKGAGHRDCPEPQSPAFF